MYSKGVLTHVESKDGIFQECYRLLKKEGLLVIIDWLSSEDGRWGENILGLMELEKLALFPETKSR
jgi:ubiquinone/menaquinone biosynthesis C-methylase UbiE